MQNKTLVVYGRPGCHLCEDMVADLHALGEFDDFDIQEIDIDEHPHLIKQYHADIPVLEYNGQRICNYFLNPMAVKEAVANV